jgi:hypothetical protein
MIRLNRYLLLAGGVGVVATASLTTQNPLGAQQQTGGDCAAMLSVARYPELVPAHISWGLLFEDIASNAVFV